MDNRLSPGKNDERGFAIWLTGLSGAGKTTISIPLGKRLIEMGFRVQILDGDVVRKKLTRDLGFTKEDRDKNIERVTFVAELMVRHGIIVICAFISPYKAERRYAREEIGRFTEVFVKCPLDVCESRDVKGLYAKARAGEIKHFTGIDDPYEIPENPEIVVDTSMMTLDDEVDKIIDYVQKYGYIKET
ncbi:MAG: adenylyl-sulfate kinase [Candidatus Marinimicrobia bacterium]|nr:adenylyl-sulfate kinase [Candidatus Neomarinimicrobiota bacterium]MCH8068812.1 adenylyl-sulfate kinase [Candidatus Neomarinimicrobiota bacterium]